ALANLELLLRFGLPLTPSGIGETERADHQRQREALADHGHENHGEGENENEVAVWKGASVGDREGNRERRRQRDDAANAREPEERRLLPRRGRVIALDRGHEPARQ